MKFEIIEKNEQNSTLKDKIESIKNENNQLHTIRSEFETGNKKLYDKISILDKEYIL